MRDDEELFVYEEIPEDGTLPEAPLASNRQQGARSGHTSSDGADERRLSELRKFLAPAALDRPQKFGDRGVTTLSIRRFQRDVLDFLGRYGTPVPDNLAVNYVRHLLVGEPRRVVDAYPQGELNLDRLWTALYRAQPPGVGSLPTLLVAEAKRVQMKRSDDPATAAESFDQYLSAYSKLDRLALPLTRSEELGMVAFTLPRHDELIDPFLQGLKNSCALGTYVGTAFSQDRYALRTLTTVIDLARMAAMNNPELLTALPLWGTAGKVPKTRFAGYFDAPAASAMGDYPVAPDTGELYAMATNSRPATTPGYTRRPGEPPRDESLTCGICVARHPDWKTPGRGHSARWCGHALGKYNPKDPATLGPATDQQIMVALEIAAQQSRKEKDKLLDSGSPNRVTRRGGPRRFNAINASELEQEEPEYDDQEAETDPSDQLN